MYGGERWVACEVERSERKERKKRTGGRKGSKGGGGRMVRKGGKASGLDKVRLKGEEGSGYRGGGGGGGGVGMTKPRDMNGRKCDVGRMFAVQ